MHAPREKHLEATHRILRYLKGTPGKGFHFKKTTNRSVEVYTDADWVGVVNDRRSTSDYCSYVWGNLVTWRNWRARPYQNAANRIICFIESPPSPVNDNSPYNVFRPRQKAHDFTQDGCKGEKTMCSHLKSFARRNLDQAKTLLEALMKREEKKRDVVECEVSLQRIQMQYKCTGITLPGFPPISSKFASSEDEFMDSDDLANSRPCARPAAVQNPPLIDSDVALAPPESVKQEFRRRHLLHGWLHKLFLLSQFCCSQNLKFQISLQLQTLYPSLILQRKMVLLQHPINFREEWAVGAESYLIDGILSCILQSITDLHRWGFLEPKKQKGPSFSSFVLLVPEASLRKFEEENFYELEKRGDEKGGIDGGFHGGEEPDPNEHWEAYQGCFRHGWSETSDGGGNGATTAIRFGGICE
ncbi:putative transcription cofactor [Hibiscus syriacus]|uniref:Transcription cofactor n=1 Tax=Hibiscus syriacus TaxID=106335 RepID=A0A6A2XDP9_HIBSY|nr:putative transcription cofactor [Hibiscus syriacus]